MLRGDAAADDDDADLDVLEMYRRESSRAQEALARLAPLQQSQSSRPRPLSGSIEALDEAAEIAIMRSEVELADAQQPGDSSMVTSQSEHETDLLARWREQRDEVDVLKAQLLGADDLQVDDYDDPEPEPGPDPEPE